jgi:hypothetical protein
MLEAPSSAAMRRRSHSSQAKLSARWARRPDGMEARRWRPVARRSSTGIGKGGDVELRVVASDSTWWLANSSLASSRASDDGALLASWRHGGTVMTPLWLRDGAGMGRRRWRLALCGMGAAAVGCKTISHRWKGYLMSSDVVVSVVWSNLFLFVSRLSNQFVFATRLLWSPLKLTCLVFIPHCYFLFSRV